MKLATIGSGVIVSQFLDAATKVDGVKLVAAYSRTIDKSIELKKKYEMNQAFDNYDQFIKSDTFDTVYIASPNNLHFQQAKDCLLANKNVIVEKPFCSNDKESLELINIAKQKGLYLFEAMSINYMPNLELLKTKLEVISPIRWIELSMCQYSSKYDEFKRGGLPNVFNPAFSGGALMDLNVYHLNFLLSLLGDPSEMSYFPALAENGIDVSGLLLLEYPDLKASLLASKNSKGKPYGIFHGENGFIEFNEGINGLRSFSLNGENYNVQEESNRLIYEVMTFESLIRNKNYVEMYRLLDITQHRMELMTKVRLKAGIRFDADN
jgi:predicted dehydrogenase